MKKNILISFLIVTNVVLLLFLGWMTWLNMLWQSTATINAEFAAKLWAANDIHKGKKVRLRLKIEDEPKGYVSSPTEFEDGLVIREQVGYTDPFPILGGQNSPDIIIQRIIVHVYNERMEEFLADPDKYKQRLADEIEYWNENVLNKKEDSN